MVVVYDVFSTAQCTTVTVQCSTVPIQCTIGMSTLYYIAPTVLQIFWICPHSMALLKFVLSNKTLE